MWQECLGLAEGGGGRDLPPQGRELRAWRGADSDSREETEVAEEVQEVDQVRGKLTTREGELRNFK